MTIETIVPGFSVFEINSRVTSKIEERLETIGGIKKYTSTSSADRSFIFIEIDTEAEAEDVKRKIRDEVSDIADFPSEMLSRPKTSEIKIDNMPTLLLGLVSKNIDAFELREKTLELKNIILNSDLVSQIYEDIPKKQLHILLDKKKMKEFKITFEEVYQMIKSSQVRLTAGNLESKTQIKNIITLSEAQNPEEIANISLRASGLNETEGIVLRVKDIGEVRYALEKQKFITKYNGKNGYKLDVVKKPQSDILDFSENIIPLVEKFSKDHPNIEVVILENGASETEQRLSIALNNGYTSFVLIFITIFIFLRKSIAFWAVFEIPVTILLTLTLMWLTDITINNVSLCGIILTLGIIVDNPAVIGELVCSYQEKGYSSEEASIMGVKKIFKPLLFALITNIGAFLSIFFIPGMLGDFAIEIPITVSFMMLSSFFESMFILPSHLAHAKLTSKQPYGDVFIQKLIIFYQKLLIRFLKRPFIYFLLILALATGVAFWSIQQINFFLFSNDQASKIFISGSTQLNKNLNFTSEQVAKIEKIIDQLPENIVHAYRTIVGGNAENNFNIYLSLTPFLERELIAQEVQDFIKQAISHDPNIKLNSIDFHIDSGGPPAGKPIEVNIFSHNSQTRKKVVDFVKQHMTTRNYFSGISTDLEENQSEFKVTPNEQISFSGITTSSIANTLRFSYEGVKVNEVHQDNDNLEWVIKLDEASRNIEDPLEDIYLLNPLRQLVHIKELVKLEESTGLPEIIKEQGRTKNTITASFDTEKVNSGLIIEELSQEYFPLQEQYPDLKITFSGEAIESQDTLTKFSFAILASVFFIYLILVIQFKNLSQPFLVISSIPFGVVGIFFAFALQDMNITFLTLIGILGFSGVVINSSIIMIDFINSQNKESHPETVPSLSVQQAVIQGAIARFRPILITSITTVIGFIPIAYKVIGETDSIVSPMTMGMLWGMLFGTLSALFIVPILFIINDTIVNYFKDLFRKTN
ncbi:swarming motility protein SwrC-like [Ylistrum balloti]|uniref:swarming motility protein SwrC-like n=1 Tax=Ylistrum balloti TaxID=509963 RepID=UPI002905E5DE|nr:swarming motility protein SwrC-like [Ylistrum balloti]